MEFSLELWLASAFFLGFLSALLVLSRNLISTLKLWARRLAILILVALVTIEFIGLPLFQKPQEVHAAVPSGVIVAWPSTNASIPSGWTRVTTLDARYVKTIATSATNPGTTGGSTTHDHALTVHTHGGNSHSHTGGTSSSNSGSKDQQSGGAVIPDTATAHTHTITADSAATASFSNNSAGSVLGSASNDPPFFEVIFIKSDGTPSGLPDQAVLFWNGGTLPTNWRECDGALGAPDMRNRFVKGAAALGNGGGTGGSSNSHTHAGVSHTHAASSTHTHSFSFSTFNNTDAVGDSSGSISVGSGGHSHGSPGTTGTASPNASAATSGATDAGDAQPPFHKLLCIQNNTGGASNPNNVIAMWDGTLASIPSSWKLSDGLNGTPNLTGNLLIKGALNSGEIGTTGGAATHSHTGGAHTHPFDSHTHTQSGTSGDATNLTVAGTLSGGQMANHTHTVSDANTGSSGGTSGSTSPGANANSDNRPPYTEVAFIQSQNTTPNAPTIMGSSPIAGSKPDKGRTTISLQANATDPDSADTVQVEWDYSTNGTDWTNIGTTTLAAQGVQTFSWNVSGLTPGSTYRLRARTIDNGGSQSSYTTQGSTWTLTSGCGPPAGGDLTISVSCAFAETVDGVDNGNITINTSITLTVNAGQTVGFNSGKAITVDGTIARNTTGQIKKSNIWMVDADSDGWPATAVQTIQDSSPGGTYRRRNLLQSDRIIDCNDAAASATNSC